MLGITAAAQAGRVSPSMPRARWRTDAQGNRCRTSCCWSRCIAACPAANRNQPDCAEIFGAAPGIGDRFFRQAVIECCNEICPDDRRPPSYLAAERLPWLSGRRCREFLVHIADLPRLSDRRICRRHRRLRYRQIRLHPDQLAGGKSYDEALWVQSVADETGWPHACVAHADLAIPTSVRCSKSWQNCRRRAASASNYIGTRTAISLCPAAGCHE